MRLPAVVLLLGLEVPAARAADPDAGPPVPLDTGSLIDRSLEPPPPPPRLGAKVLMGTGAALLVGGLVGALVSPYCATRAADGRCVDPRGMGDVYPAMMFVGLATAITGSFWWRQDAPDARD